MVVPPGLAEDQVQACMYCRAYNQIHLDYPVNPATYDLDSEVPRCELHSQYSCSHCEKAYHFNGISYCADCRAFTCLRCGKHSVEREKFLVYTFFYLISCTTCGLEIETLEYAETQGTHPFQMGGARPKTEQLQVWLPFGTDIAYKPEYKTWGLKRLRDMTKSIPYEAVEEKEGDSKKVWDANAEIWKELTRAGDVNHNEIIIPQMLAYMDPERKIVMDVACGEGNFTRKLANSGYYVTGTDVSNLIDYAIQSEEEMNLGIQYRKIGVHQLKDHFDENSFQQVTMNMAIMDIDNLDKILENIAYILQPGGKFVFSLTHPVTAWPAVRTIKLPDDSQKNIDKGWLVDDYAKEIPMKIYMPDLPSPMLYYPRKISTYVNSLVNQGFVITAMEEPIPEMVTINKFPRDMMDDYDRNPVFMIVQTTYLG